MRPIFLCLIEVYSARFLLRARSPFKLKKKDPVLMIFIQIISVEHGAKIMLDNPANMKGLGSFIHDSNAN